LADELDHFLAAMSVGFPVRLECASLRMTAAWPLLNRKTTQKIRETTTIATKSRIVSHLPSRKACSPQEGAVARDDLR
jgi:hypothetical protein